jgi:hypothetical protein
VREHAAQPEVAARGHVEMLVEAVLEVELSLVTSCMTATAVNVFVIEPMRYWCSASQPHRPPRRRGPTASAQSTSPSRRTAPAIEGSRSSVWCFARTARSSAASSSDSGKSSERARDRVDRRRRCPRRRRRDASQRELRRPHGRREKHAFVLHPRHRLLARQPERPTSTCTKFVSTCSRSTGTPASCSASPSRARARGLRRGARRCGRARRRRPPRRSRPAHRAAHQVLAATRVPRELGRRREQAPSGQPRPFERHSVTVSNRGRTRPARSRSPSTRS